MESFKDFQKKMLKTGYDKQDIVDYISRFKQVKNKMSTEDKDISNWMNRPFEEFMLHVIATERKKSKAEKRKAIKDNDSDLESITAYDGEYATVTIPLTREESCNLGQNNPWCISTRDMSNNEFNNYTERNKVFCFIKVDVDQLKSDYENEDHTLKTRINELDINYEDAVNHIEMIEHDYHKAVLELADSSKDAVLWSDSNKALNNRELIDKLLFIITGKSVSYFEKEYYDKALFLAKEKINDNIDEAIDYLLKYELDAIKDHVNDVEYNENVSEITEASPFNDSEYIKIADLIVENYINNKGISDIANEAEILRLYCTMISYNSDLIAKMVSKAVNADIMGKYYSIHIDMISQMPDQMVHSDHYEEEHEMFFYQIMEGLKTRYMSNNIPNETAILIKTMDELIDDAKSYYNIDVEDHFQIFNIIKEKLDNSDFNPKAMMSDIQLFNKVVDDDPKKTNALLSYISHYKKYGVPNKNQLNLDFNYQVDNTIRIQYENIDAIKFSNMRQAKSFYNALGGSDSDIKNINLNYVHGFIERSTNKPIMFISVIPMIVKYDSSFGNEYLGFINSLQESIARKYHMDISEIADSGIDDLVEESEIILQLLNSFNKIMPNFNSSLIAKIFSSMHNDLDPQLINDLFNKLIEPLLRTEPELSSITKSIMHSSLSFLQRIVDIRNFKKSIEVTQFDDYIQNVLTPSNQDRSQKNINFGK